MFWIWSKKICMWDFRECHRPSFKHSRTSLIQISAALREALLFQVFIAEIFFNCVIKKQLPAQTVNETYRFSHHLTFDVFRRSACWLMFTETRLLHQLTRATLSLWHRFPVTLITLPPHGYSSSRSARQMMTSACSQRAHNDHSQTKGQHMPANSSLKADLFQAFAT